MLLCDDGHVSEVYVSVVEEVSIEPGPVDVPTDQPVYQSFLHQLTAQFQSVGGSNNVVGSIPTIDHAIETPSVNLVIAEDPTINEVMPVHYDEDENSIPDYNPYSEYGLDDFNKDYIGHGGSCEGVNDETTHYDGMESDPFEVSGISLKPKEIMADMQMEHGLGLLYSKALKAKELAEQNVFGSPDLSYQLLPAYCHQLKLVNPDTVTTIKTNDAQQFEYLFIALSASLFGFQTAIRPAICIDATNLKDKFGGVMFIAACQNANNQVFPLAYGWGDVECEDSWTWFLKELNKAIGCLVNCIIISYRSPVIKVAMGKNYPEITHVLCGFHMNMNLKNRFKSHIVCNLFHKASRAHRQSEFLKKIQELSRVNKRAYEYLMRVEPYRWSRAYCSVRHYRGMTSNIVECMNNCLRYARQLPITTLVEYIRDMMQKWFHE
ncbi:hypothetical protein QYF36_002259 [Acer negundo]|nr:hypothetical protein QYF36_002259 [Acer negundo]